jgi:hypothetical protein
MYFSGYIAFIFSKFGYEIPLFSISIGEIVKNIELTEIKKRCLLFFKGRKIKKQYDWIFIHSSRSEKWKN